MSWSTVFGRVSSLVGWRPVAKFEPSTFYNPSTTAPECSYFLIKNNQCQLEKCPESHFHISMSYSCKCRRETRPKRTGQYNIGSPKPSGTAGMAPCTRTGLPGTSRPASTSINGHCNMATATEMKGRDRRTDIRSDPIRVPAEPITKKVASTLAKE